MKLNALYGNKHIDKVGNNAYQFAILNEFFHYYLLQYKIREFDVVGAIEAEQWDVAYWAAKACLQIAIKIFLFYTGVQQYSNEVGYILLVRLKLALLDDVSKYEIIEHLFYSNSLDEDGMKKEIGLTRMIIKDYLIPSEVWELWGREKQFHFSSYLDSVLITKRAFENIDKTLMARPTYPIELLEEMNKKSQRISKGK